MKKENLKGFQINKEKAQYSQVFEGVEVHSPYELYDGQKQYISYVMQCLNKGQNGLMQSPTGTGKTLSLLISTLSWANQQMQKGKELVRVIYTSRTHSQLKQVVGELKKTGYQPKIAVLGSKDQTCLNEQLKELSGNSKELECRLRVNKKNNLSCKYFHIIQHQQFYERFDFMGTMMDLEEIGSMGHEQHFCPFFYEKKAKQTAHLILMPYNYVFSPREWDEQNGFFSDSILIFDEAHNIQQVCEEAKQITINTSVFAKALQHASQLRQIKLKENNHKIERTLKSTSEEIQLHASFIASIHAHIQTIDLPVNDEGTLWEMNRFLNFLNEGTSNGEYGELENNIIKLCSTLPFIKNDIKFKPFWALDMWFSFIFRVSQLFRKRKQSNVKDYKCQISFQGTDIKLHIICFNPQNGFRRVQDLNPKSVFVTSGTLSPLNTWPLQLGTKFAKPLACPHILKKQQVNGCVLIEGPNKVKINFSYQNRNNQEIYKQLGFILLEIATKTPNGVLVFFPSYALLDKVKLELGNVNILSRIYEQKTIFFEKKNNKDFKASIDSYLKEAMKPKGAMFFALTRGKISEGLDFSDEKCRAVVIVGVPFPAARDVKVVAKRQYLDGKPTSQKTITGDQWYQSQTIRCINQSIGRIIRNKEDFGSIYLLDQRYKRNELLSQISSWARQSLRVISNYDDFSLKIKAFNDYFSKKQANLVQKNYFQSQLGTKLGGIQMPDKLIRGSISQSTVKEVPSINPLKDKTFIEEINPEKKDEKKEQKKEKQRIIFSRPSKKVLIDEKKECQVCRMDKKLIKNSECVHELCEACWKVWLKQDLRCPICRVRVRQKYLVK